jgi:hypothetical protein
MLRHKVIFYQVVSKWHGIEIIPFVYLSTQKVSRMFSTFSPDDLKEEDFRGMAAQEKLNLLIFRKTSTKQCW